VFAKPSVGNESVVKLAPAGVAFSVVASRPSAVRQCDETSAVKTHGIAGNSAGNACERQAEKSTFRIAINAPHQADVVTAHIEKQRRRHQVRVAHVIIFVLEQTLEPVAVRDRVLAVVMIKPRGNVFARKTARQ
jgi:hypothetical protein